MKYIKVNIECHTDTGERMSHVPEELREELMSKEDRPTEYREGIVFIEHILAIYPWSTGQSHFIMACGETFTARETIQEIEELIRDL